MCLPTIAPVLLLLWLEEHSVCGTCSAKSLHTWMSCYPTGSSDNFHRPVVRTSTTAMRRSDKNYLCHS